MSLRPADLGGVISQSSNVERLSQATTQQSRAHQEAVTLQVNQQTERAQSEVQGTPPAEGSTIRDSEGGGGGAGGGGGRRRRAPEETPEEEARPVARPRRNSRRIDFKA